MSAKVENHGVAGHINLPRQDINLKLVVVEPDKLGEGKMGFCTNPYASWDDSPCGCVCI